MRLAWEYISGALLRRRPRLAVAALLAAALFCGCSRTMVSVKETGQRGAYEAETESALTSDALTNVSKIVLKRTGLERKFKDEPHEAIKKLAAAAAADTRRDTVFALAELCYLTAKEDEARWLTTAPCPPEDSYLAAAVCAYVAIFGKYSDDSSDLPYTREFRLACDIYNYSLAKAFAGPDGRIKVSAGQRKTPAGDLTLQEPIDNGGFTGKDYEGLIPSSNYKITGLSVHHRTAGLGCPFIAVRSQSDGLPVPWAKSGSLFLKIGGGSAPPSLAAPLRGEIVLADPLAGERVTVGGATYPLECDYSTPIAYSLRHPYIWRMGLDIFISGFTGAVNRGIYSLEPVSPQKIPVVFVHGTMSSIFLWAEMWNTLSADPVIRKNYQFWFYLYDSGKPIPYSVVEFREDLQSFIAAHNAKTGGKGFSRIVLIGHSQGGLLAKGVSTDTGDTLIKTLLGKNTDEIRKILEPEDAAFLERYLITTRVPEVTRVIFMATPHRGSFLSNTLTRMFIRNFITVPVNIQTVLQIERIKSKLGLPEDISSATSLDSMSTQNPVLLKMADIPVSKGVRAHSVIAISGDAKPPAGDDGVVSYKSAHVNYAESEFVARSGHSVQFNPPAIEEVRRILIENLRESSGPAADLKNR